MQHLKPKILNKMLFSLTVFSFISSCQKPQATSSTEPTQENSLASQAIKSDIPQDPIDCAFNDTIVTDGGSIIAYQNSSVPFGESCVSETRSCTQGLLSGSYNYLSCQVGQPSDCLFNGATIPHGESVTAYSASSVEFNQSCVSVAETRICQNGVLSGSANYGSCQVNSPQACLFDGRTIEHGNSVLAYQSSSVGFGASCVSENRTCQDGTLSGQFIFSSCTTDQPASCLFDGRTIAHGENVIAFAASSVGFNESCTSETRTCQNGQLTGQFSFGSCVKNQPLNCEFNGSTVMHNQSVTTYASSSVGFGESCLSENRTCENGILSGQYTQTQCVVLPAKDCQFNDQIISHGTQITAYPQFSVPFGETCASEIRICTNGILSGSAQYESCAPQMPTTDQKNCVIGDQTLQDQEIKTFFQSSQVSFGEVCISEQRQCQNGVLSGNFTNSSCTVTGPKDCELNGKIIAHGSEITTFMSASVPSNSKCQSEIRSCFNGVLSGSATAESCIVQNEIPNDQVCGPKIIWEFPKDCHGKCGKGNGYFKSRISKDNGKTWLEIHKNKLPQELDEVWEHLHKKYGENKCGRPNVQYLDSKNKGYVVLGKEFIPDCQTCRFVEVEIEIQHENKCHKNKKSSTKKVMKYVCEQEKKSKKSKSSHHDHDHDDDHDHDHEDQRNSKYSYHH